MLLSRGILTLGNQALLFRALHGRHLYRELSLGSLLTVGPAKDLKALTLRVMDTAGMPCLQAFSPAWLHSAITTPHIRPCLPSDLFYSPTR